MVVGSLVFPLTVHIIIFSLFQSKRGEVKAAVSHAISVGYRFIDTAYGYGNEKEVGAGIREKIADGTVSRDEIFLASKVLSTSYIPGIYHKSISYNN